MGLLMLKYQTRVAAWVAYSFGKKSAATVSERNHRFIEEALELVQAAGTSKEDVLTMLDYVYSRPAGEVYQEVGGVMVTLAALCNALGLGMADAGETELAQNWRKVETIKLKHATKPLAL